MQELEMYELTVHEVAGSTRPRLTNTSGARSFDRPKVIVRFASGCSKQ